jgi:hypothetical protein
MVQLLAFIGNVGLGGAANGRVDPGPELPGESVTFRVRAPVALDAGQAKAPWVLTDLASVLRS